MRKRVFTLLTSSFLAFKSFDAYSHDSEMIAATEMFSSELKRQMAEAAFLKMYNEIDFGDAKKPAYEVFRRGLIGVLNMKQAGLEMNDKNILSLADFSLPSSEKRLWIIDLDDQKLLFHELVAHGRTTGALMAEKFSNRPHSNSSSLGFYLTGEEYVGKYGRSLRLDGMETGYNDNARDRAVVLHGADYVSESFVKRVGRLGRSQGCPAVPFKNKDAIVDAIKDQTVLYLHANKADYLKNSVYQNVVEAIDFFAGNGFSLKGEPVSSVGV